MAKISFHEYFFYKYVIKLAIQLHYTGLHSDIDTNWRSVTPWLLHIIVRLGTCRYRVPVQDIVLPIHFTHLHITAGLPNVCRRHGILAN